MLRTGSLALPVAVLALGCVRPATTEPSAVGAVDSVPTTQPPPATDTTVTPEPASAPTTTAVGTEGEPGPWVGLCDPSSPAFAQAQTALQALEQQVERLDPAADAKRVNEAANDLLAHECFALGSEDAGLFTFDFTFGVEVKAFWAAGGDVWMRQYLSLTQPDNEDLWVLPSPRKAWTRQTHPDHPLARFLCSAQLEDDECTQSIYGWRSRASRYYELWNKGTSAPQDDCLEHATKGPARQAYAAWRDCENEQAGTHAALPLGGLGQVDEGWLVVRGRRGHYSFCDGIAAYDLKTGSAYRIESCSGLALTDGGGVDHRQTDARRKVEVTAGTIPVALLREAAWATFTVPFVDSDIVHEATFGRPVPDGMVIGRESSTSFSGLGFSMSFSSAHTTLDWQWVEGVDAVPLTGDMSWPSDLNNAAGDHAVRLLQIAEDALEPGCAKAKLPGWLADGLELGRVSGLDADAKSLSETSEALRDAMVDAAGRGRCPKRR